MVAKIIKSPNFLATLPAIVVLGAFSYGAFTALSLPDMDPLGTFEEDETEVVVEEPPKVRREYIAIQHSVKATIPHLGATVNIYIGVAIPDMVLHKTADMFKDDPTDFIAPLSQIVMDLSETEAGESWQTLRQALPEPFKESINQQFIDMGLNPPVIEVLINRFMIGG